MERKTCEIKRIIKAYITYKQKTKLWLTMTWIQQPWKFRLVRRYMDHVAEKSNKELITMFISFDPTTYLGALSKRDLKYSGI